MNFRKPTLILMILLCAAAVWAPRQWRLHQAQRALEEANAYKQRLELHLQNAGVELAATRRKLTEAKLKHSEVLAEVAKASAKLTKADPESRWVQPPPALPDWNGDSPYIWIHKDMVPRLPVPVFTRDGELRPEVAFVMTVSPEQQATLNSALKRCLDEYHSVETTKVEQVDKDLPGIANQEGVKMTIQVPPLPEEGARAKMEFETALHDVLGEQRAELLTKTASYWIDKEFSQFGTDPKTISMIRHPNGSYNISIKSGRSWMSVGVDKSRPDMIYNYIPPHLVPFFKEVIGPVGADASATTAQ